MVYALFCTLLMILVTLAPAQATSWFVDNAASGSNTGTSWANAWTAFASIAWGSIAAGDTVFISGGSSTKTYNAALAIGASGSSTVNRVTIKIGQDAGHTGIAIINGNLTLNSRDYVTVDGQVSGDTTTQHFRVQNASIESQSNLNPILRYIESVNSNISAQFGFHGLFQSLYMHNMAGDAAISFAGRNDKDGPNEVHAYDDVIVEDSHIILNASASEDGTGADGIQGCPGLTLRNSTMETTPTGTIGTNHMDFIQSQAIWISMYGNILKDSADSIFDYDCYNGSTPNHFRIFNNVFIKNRGGAAIRFYGSGAIVCSSFDNIHINNNTFVDHTCCASPVVGFSNFNGNPTVTNSEIKNNIFYNDSLTNSLIIAASTGFTAANWNVDFNILASSGTLSVDGTDPYIQTNPRTCTPSFVGYSFDSISSDLHLASGDTCAKDAGTSLSTQFTTDKDGNSRPQGSTWDIGAYELVSGGGAVPTIVRISR